MMELAFSCGGRYIQVERFAVSQEGRDFLHKLLTNAHLEICRGQYREQQATTAQMTRSFSAFILIFPSLSHRYKREICLQPELEFIHVEFEHIKNNVVVTVVTADNHSRNNR